ncbi:MAG: S8 family serine peptidase [Bdellovibrio sp.]|nr:S8 family serine peptidase [Bdellovibrio sp.]
MNRKFILGAVFFLSQKNFAAINKDILQIYKPRNVVVAIVDTGADIQHKDLKDFIWTNEGETGLDQFGRSKESNQIDDDGNGFADDVHGWNFISNNNKVTDDLGHGTHIAGIIKSEFVKHSSNSTVSPSVRLMILKYFDPNASNEANLINSTRAIQYANKMKAQVINYSGGGGEPYVQELLAIKESAQQDILFVAAAGNNNSNMDVQKYYPASYGLGNIISVAATNNHGDFVAFSNYGATVDVAAPGKSIYSTLPNKGYGFMSGTSQSTAFVSGLAASLLATHKKSPQKLISEIKNSGTFNKTLIGKTKSQMALINPTE